MNAHTQGVSKEHIARGALLDTGTKIDKPVQIAHRAGLPELGDFVVMGAH